MIDPPTDTPSTFLGAGALELFARRWPPEGSPRAAVGIVHGFGDHSGRYAAAVEAMTRAGYAVHAFDLRGHGRSPGRRGHVGAWSDYRDDLTAFVGHVHAQEVAATPVFLYGHSLGAAIALECGLREPIAIDGLVASAPSLVPSGVRDARQEALAAVMSRVWPTLTLELQIELAALSRDARLVEATRVDPLYHRRITVRTAAVGLATFEWTLANAGRWRLPLLAFHGAADRIVDPAATIAFADAARAGGAPDVTRTLYLGGYHELHNDIDATTVMADVVAWVEAHISPIATATPAAFVSCP